MTSLPHKTCSKCQVKKPLSEFYKAEKAIRSRDGYGFRCRSCVDTDIYKRRRKSASSTNRRKALKKDNGVFYVSPRFLRKLYTSSCVICKSMNDIQQDHVVPLTRGGAHSEGNLQPLCKSCNLAKSGSLMVEFRLRRPDLFSK